MKNMGQARTPMGLGSFCKIVIDWAENNAVRIHLSIRYWVTYSKFYAFNLMQWVLSPCNCAGI